jgi:hypothetical protein
MRYTTLKNTSRSAAPLDLFFGSCKGVLSLDKASHQVGIKGPRLIAGALLYLTRFTCKTLENKSGGTRIRTGDTMIFSHVRKPLGMR